MSEIPKDPEERDAYIRERAEAYSPGDDSIVRFDGGCYDLSIATPEECGSAGGNWRSNACWFDECPD